MDLIIGGKIFPIKKINSVDRWKAFLEQILCFVVWVGVWQGSRDVRYPGLAGFALYDPNNMQIGWKIVMFLYSTIISHTTHINSSLTSIDRQNNFHANEKIIFMQIGF